MGWKRHKRHVRSEDVLTHLSTKSNLPAFPSLAGWTDTDAPTAAVRLRCFAGDGQWLIVGEELWYDMDQWGGNEAFARGLLLRHRRATQAYGGHAGEFGA